MASAPVLVSVFTRLPAAGSSKTRLVPALGVEGAAALQRAMTEHVVLQALVLRATDRAIVEARVADGPLGAAREWLDVPCAEQGAGDLGHRLERALAEGLRHAEVALVVGGDCPGADARDLREAANAARSAGAAIVPAHDGGFCALALGSGAPVDGLLAGIDWGSERVCDQTLARLADAGIAAAVLPARADIDRPEDLQAWEAVRRAWYEPPSTLGVVIPALNEAGRLPALLAALLAEAPDCIVVDGGSGDATVEVAHASGARVLEGAAGRGAQMNAGARALGAGAPPGEWAEGTPDALLFLHADSVVPPGFVRAALDVLADPEVALGAFRFSLDARTPSLRLIEAGTDVRSRLLGMPYGDQGLFMRTAMWRALGGFPEWPAMEDYELVRRAKRVGRVEIAPLRLVTSDRRWREKGVWRQTAANLGAVARFRLGASPASIAGRRERHSKR